VVHTITFFDDCVSDLKIPKKWEDISYSNDVCPSFAYKGYQIWIDHIDYQQRENGQDTYRFAVTKEKEYGEGVNPLLLTDNFNVVLELLEKLNPQPRE